MDDSCAVCAETLEWVAYGPCGHRDVCSTCVVRLRFICDDRRCCICKTESNVVFVTKRHNAKEHGGRMSRSQRSAALQVCIIFLTQAYF
ncbi:hypothetical protein L1049_007360 [Liquidambar formosana]|uniref:RING-type domain-containing protein n=1 Tax=Liquidambar formosana TaxID=63359 RepID=A0AAP0N6S9_LIQFO